MDKALAEFSMLWRNVGMLNDYSKILEPDYDFTKASYSDYIDELYRNNNDDDNVRWHPEEVCPKDVAEDIILIQSFDEFYEQSQEDTVVSRLQLLNDHWDRVLYNVHDKIADLLRKHEVLIRDMNELSVKEVTLQRNFRTINQSFNTLTLNKSLLSDKIAQMEEMYSHYSDYLANERLLDQIENNRFITQVDREVNLNKTLEYVEEIGVKINEMLENIDNSLIFFTIHPDYHEAEDYGYRYEQQRHRVFSLIKMIFTELYTVASSNPDVCTNFDISQLYNKYRMIGRVIKKLIEYYNNNNNETTNSELLQLQMYYIANRIKILNPILNSKMESLNDFQDLSKLFTPIFNLEILTFYDTFHQESCQDSLLAMVSNISYYFVESCRRCMKKVKDRSSIYRSLETIRDDFICYIDSSDHKAALQPLLVHCKSLYQSLEQLLVKDIRNDITKLIKKYDKNEYLSVYKAEDTTKVKLVNGPEEIDISTNPQFHLENLFPPVIHSITLIQENYEYLSKDNQSKLSIEILNAVKLPLLDFQYLIRKINTLDKTFKKINEEFFLIRNLSHLLKKLTLLKTLEPFTTLEKLLQQNKQLFVSDAINLLTEDFNAFTHKIKEHNEQQYIIRKEMLLRSLSVRMPELEGVLNYQLPREEYEPLMAEIYNGITEVINRYNSKFNLNEDTIEHKYTPNESTKLILMF